MEEFTLGCIPEFPSSTSYMYDVIAGGGEELPDVFELTDVPKHYQNGQPCCTSSSSSSAKGKQEKTPLSPRVLWTKVKEIDDFSGGAYITTNLKILTDYGIPPYDVVDENVHVSEYDYKHATLSEQIKELAKEHLISSYWWVYSDDIEMQYNALVNEKVPLVLAMPWYKEYYSTPKDGFLSEPKTFVGYHAVLFKGRRKDENGYYRVYQNSHGEDWGDNGDFYIYEKDLARHKLGTHFVMVDISQEDAKEIKNTTWNPNDPKVKLVRGDEVRYMNEIFVPYLTGKQPNSKGNFIRDPYKLA